METAVLEPIVTCFVSDKKQIMTERNFVKKQAIAVLIGLSLLGSVQSAPANECLSRYDPGGLNLQAFRDFFALATETSDKFDDKTDFDDPKTMWMIELHCDTLKQSRFYLEKALAAHSICEDGAGVVRMTKWLDALNDMIGPGRYCGFPE